MAWYRRRKENISTPSQEKKEIPSGLWELCPSCKSAVMMKELEIHVFVCPNCQHHFRIGSEDYFDLLFDKKSYTLLFEKLTAADPLQFKDRRTYAQRLEKAKTRTGLADAMRVAVGKVRKQEAVIAAMDFAFIGGSMGAVVGEKIARAVDYCIAHRIALVIISKSGGARMMESVYALMQMAKTTAKLTELAAAHLPYISIMTDPTTGGVSASFAMLGDIHIAEPKALIGFAGPRVIRETIKKDLPEGFQRAEFLLEHGFLDVIVHRKELKQKLGEILAYF